MKALTLPGIDDYAEQHSTPAPQALQHLAEETRLNFDMPQMISGDVVGGFLQMLVYALRPLRVLEIGTFTGYSTLSMAAALPPGGRIISCELNERHAAFARRHIAESAHAQRIDVRIGPALETIAGLDEEFDFVFIDADKVNYINYLEAVLPKLSTGGLIAADNTLWNGDVLDPTIEDAETAALRRFNDKVRSDPGLVCVLLTLRDGVTLIRPA